MTMKLEQVIEKDAYGEERDEDVNVFVGDDGEVALRGEDVHHGPQGKRPDELRQAEKVLSENAYGEEVRDINVILDTAGPILLGDDTHSAGARWVIGRNVAKAEKDDYNSQTEENYTAREALEDLSYSLENSPECL